MIDRCYLEITNVCNLDCVFCPGHNRQGRQLSAGEFDMLTDRLKDKVKFLYFHLMGEPFLNRLLPQFVASARSKGFIPVLTTNGTLFPKAGAQVTANAENHADAYAVADALPYKINISLHSFEGNMGTDLDGYLSQVMDFARYASAKGVLVVLRLWNKDGYDSENDRILELVRSKVSDAAIRTSPGAIQKNSYAVSGLDTKSHRSKTDSIKLAPKLYLEYDSMFQWPELDGADYGDRLFCYALRNQIGVLADGSVVPCCLDHNGDMVLGNLFNEPLDDILKSERARNMYDGFTSHHVVEPLCRSCGYAMLTKQYHS